MPRPVLGLLASLMVLGAPAPVAGPAAVPAGIWKGRWTPAGGEPRAALAFVLPDPHGGIEARLVVDDTSLAGLRLDAGGRGHGSFFPAFAGGRACTVRLREVHPRVRFSGTLEAADGAPASFLFDEYLSLYDVRTDLPAMAGGYRSGRGQNSLGLDLHCHLRADGSMRVWAADQLLLAGALQLPDREKSAFQFRYGLTLPGQPRRTGSGLGYFFVNPRTFVRTFLMTGAHGDQGLLATFVFEPPRPRP